MHSQLVHRLEVEGQLHALAGISPRRNAPLSGPQSWCGCKDEKRNLYPCQKLKQWSHYIDWDIPAKYFCDNMNFNKKRISGSDLWTLLPFCVCFIWNFCIDVVESKFYAHPYHLLVYRRNKSRHFQVCHDVILKMILLLSKTMVEDFEKLIVAQLAKKFLLCNLKIHNQAKSMVFRDVTL
jgi:hypothetical protein